MRHPRDTELVINERVAQWFVRTVTIIWGIFGAGIGASILVGGDSRFSGVSYEVAKNTPGAPASWGIAILTAGLCILVGAILGKPRVTAAGGLLGACWGVLFACSFVLASVRHPEANNTAFWAYAAIATMFGLCGGVNLIMSPPRWLRRLHARLVRKA